MMIIALIMRPWIGIIRALGANVSCHILADDVLVITKVIEMASKLADAINSTRQYLQRMGARMAPDKSYNFSTSPTVRAWPKETWWRHIDALISSPTSDTSEPILP